MGDEVIGEERVACFHDSEEEGQQNNQRQSRLKNGRALFSICTGLLSRFFSGWIDLTSQGFFDCRHCSTLMIAFPRRVIEFGIAGRWKTVFRTAEVLTCTNSIMCAVPMQFVSAVAQVIAVPSLQEQDCVTTGVAILAIFVASWVAAS